MIYLVISYLEGMRTWVKSSGGNFWVGNSLYDIFYSIVNTTLNTSSSQFTVLWELEALSAKKSQYFTVYFVDTLSSLSCILTFRLATTNSSKLIRHRTGLNIFIRKQILLFLVSITQFTSKFRLIIISSDSPAHYLCGEFF